MMPQCNATLIILNRFNSKRYAALRSAGIDPDTLAAAAVGGGGGAADGSSSNSSVGDVLKGAALQLLQDNAGW